jgi:hypothetical protein
LQKTGAGLEAACCGRVATQYRLKAHAANDHTGKLLHCTSFRLGKTLYFFIRENPEPPTQPGVAMNYLFALFQKVSDLFASPHLPLDSDYSYEARHREAERVRKSQATLFGVRLTD